MKINDYLVKEGSRPKITKRSTDDTANYTDKAEAGKDLEKNIDRMRELQNILYAQDIHSLLIIFQAMDAAGKDSAIKHVMSGVNPQGCQVVSFKQPSAEERDHDFLWRHQKALPERGRIGIFNRSHYEEVLVVRVHSEILQAQQLPDSVKRDPKIWEKRFKQIRDWENHLAENGTAILKFFLNVSKEEQRKRFLARIDEPTKNWKFSIADVRERTLWNDYMKAYEEAIAETSTRNAPWYVIPADKKWFAQLLISTIIVDRLERLDLRYPQLSNDRLAELAEAKRMLESE
ncbi:MAG: polyphosphate--nucleotide phosphotransferase [Blastocatellia bacterium]